MIRISETEGAYRALFDSAPNDRFSVANFDTGQEGPSIAYAVLLEKPINLPLASAFSLLWSREFIFVEEWDMDQSKSTKEIWDYALSGDYMSNEFARFVARSTFSPIAPSVGRNRIKNRLQEMGFDRRSGKARRSKSGSERCIGQIASRNDFRERLTGFEFLQAFEVTSNWNDESYFFETLTDIGYFSWGTSA